MKWSLEEVAEVPAGVVTVTSTVAAAWAGATAVMRVSLLTRKLAGRLPKRTSPASARFVPVICTTVPPPVEPEVVSRLLTVGADAAL